MKGTVTLLNRDDAMAAVETETDEFSIIGLMSDDGLDVGDLVEGALDADGAVSLRNETRGSMIEAYVEASAVSEASAREQLDGH